jgi:hypothetical protein
MERFDRPMPPVHLHRPRRTEATIQQTLRQAQTQSCNARKKTITMPKPLVLKREK